MPRATLRSSLVPHSIQRFGSCVIRTLSHVRMWGGMAYFWKKKSPSKSSDLFIYLFCTVARVPCDVMWSGTSSNSDAVHPRRTKASATRQRKLEISPRTVTSRSHVHAQWLGEDSESIKHQRRGDFTFPFKRNRALSLKTSLALSVSLKTGQRKNSCLLHLLFDFI